MNDICPHTLVKFMEDNTKTKKALNNKSLQRKLKQSHKELEHYRNEYLRLKEELNKLGVETQFNEKGKYVGENNV